MCLKFHDTMASARATVARCNVLAVFQPSRSDYLGSYIRMG